MKNINDEFTSASLKDVKDLIGELEVKLMKEINAIRENNPCASEHDSFKHSIKALNQIVEEQKQTITTLKQDLQLYTDTIQITRFKEDFTDKVIINGNVRIKGNTNIEGIVEARGHLKAASLFYKNKLEKQP